MCVLPLELENPVITVQLEIELVKATAADLKELDCYIKVIDGPAKKVERLRQNLPFWLVAPTGEIEPNIHFLNEDWHPNEIKQFLDNERIYLHKDSVFRS